MVAVHIFLECRCCGLFLRCNSGYLVQGLIMRFLELRGKSLIAIILLTSGFDFLLFGC